MWRLFCDLWRRSCVLIIVSAVAISRRITSVVWYRSHVCHLVDRFFFGSGLEDRRRSISGRWYKRLCKLLAVILFIHMSRHTCKKVPDKYRQNLVFKTDSTCTYFRIRPLITQDNKTVPILVFCFPFLGQVILIAVVPCVLFILSMSLCFRNIYIYIYIYICVCVCVCVYRVFQGE